MKKIPRWEVPVKVEICWDQGFGQRIGKTPINVRKIRDRFHKATVTFIYDAKELCFFKFKSKTIKCFKNGRPK